MEINVLLQFNAFQYKFDLLKVKQDLTSRTKYFVFDLLHKLLYNLRLAIFNVAKKCFGEL